MSIKYYKSINTQKYKSCNNQVPITNHILRKLNFFFNFSLIYEYAKKKKKNKKSKFYKQNKIKKRPFYLCISKLLITRQEKSSFNKYNTNNAILKIEKTPELSKKEEKKKTTGDYFSIILKGNLLVN